ncbi:cytoskeleton-associated protein 2 [Diretmus argenteus]
MSVAPVHLKGKDTLPRDAQKAKPKQGDMKVKSGEAVKKVTTTEKDVKGGAATDAKRQTLTQVFLAEQAARHKKFVDEAPKPPAAVPPSKPAAGMYKGKIVQSKIGSIWKSSITAGEPKQNPTAKAPAPKTQTRKNGNLTTIRSKSAVDLHGRDVQKRQPTRSKSVTDGPAPISRRPVTGHHAAGVRTVPPPARTVPPSARTVPATRSSSRNVTAKPQGRGTQSSKPQMPVVTDKINKPPVSSTISQYRMAMETAEERRAKLAEWLASKGKTLKRPTMASAAPPKTKAAAKPGGHLKSQLKSRVAPQPAARRDPEPGLDGHRPGSPAAHPEDLQRPQEPTPLKMNSTLDLLDNSDLDLPVDPEPRMNDIVVNLCDELEAMGMSSEDGPLEVAEKCTTEDEYQEELKSELSEEVADETEDVKVKAEVETDDAEEVESDEDDDSGVMETTPKMEDASVVKYSVKTTPYLQSVKKTIEDEASACGSRRKSNIKDLKFLTPVRRSCRIKRQATHLPSMLMDHDPCVSSLAELVQLDDDANAYVYRRNPALLEDLPDQPKDL